MTDAGFTKGPWTIWGANSRDGHLTVGIANETGAKKHIAYLAWPKDESQAAGSSTGMDDARLIAAAPDLFEAAARLTKALTRLSNNMNEFGTITDPEFLDDVWVAQDKLDAALLKAQSGEPK